jgi:hypothetical protein
MSCSMCAQKDTTKLEKLENLRNQLTQHWIVLARIVHSRKNIQLYTWDEETFGKYHRKSVPYPTRRRNLPNLEIVNDVK